jgi:putative addiction module CopG family antidote
MAISLTPELDRQVQEKLASGMYQSVDDLLRAALRALDHEEQNIAAIAESNADFEAGRYESWEESDEEFRKQRGIPKAE